LRNGGEKEGQEKGGTERAGEQYNLEMEDVAKAPKIDAKLLAEVVEESHAWAVAHGLVMGLPGGTAFATKNQNSDSILHLHLMLAIAGPRV
jgi:hypothetical protein